MKGKKPTPDRKVLDGIDRIRDVLQKEFGGTVTVAMTTPEPGRGRTPWGGMATIKGFDESYASMARVLEKIERDRKTEKLIGERRFSRLAITYNGAKNRGRRGRTQREWTVGEIAPWGVSSSRAANAVNYARSTYGGGGTSNPAGPSRAVGLKIWISTDTAREWIDDGGDE